MPLRHIIIISQKKKKKKGVPFHHNSLNTLQLPDFFSDFSFSFFSSLTTFTCIIEPYRSIIFNFFHFLVFR